IGGTTKNPADDYEWGLYNVEDDFSEAKNIAKDNPKKLRELQDLWWSEAAKYNVLPLDDRVGERIDPTIRPSLTKGRTKFTYYPGMKRIPEGSAPQTRNRSFRITADVDIPAEGASGVLATMGGRFGGWGLIVMDGQPRFDYTLSNEARYRWQVAAKDKLPAGKHTIHIDFKYDGGGPGKGATAILSVDGKEVARGRIERTISLRFSLDESFDVGEDTGTPVAEDYADRMPFRFTGELRRLVIDLGNEQGGAPDAKQLKKLHDLRARAVALPRPGSCRGGFGPTALPLQPCPSYFRKGDPMKKASRLAKLFQDRLRLGNGTPNKEKDATGKQSWLPPWAVAL